MQIEPIIRQLQTYLPQFTRLFSDSFSVNSLTCSGNTVTAITDLTNNLVTGDTVNIIGSLIDINIISLTSINNIATAVTDFDHDLTFNWQIDITISGANESNYNGTFELISVSNRRTFTFKLLSPITGTATGSPVLVDNYTQGYNGFHLITVINSTTFTYDVEQTLPSPSSGIIFALSKNRISGAITIERAMESYTKQQQNNAWCFVVPGSTTANKDRYTLSDATYEAGNSVKYWQRLIDVITVYAIIPTTGSIAARQEWDLLQSRAMIPIMKTLCGTHFPTGLDHNPWAQMVFVGSDFYSYNNAYFIAEYNFETQRDLTYKDLIVGRTSAFKDIHIDYYEDGSFSSPIAMTSDINLDNVPL